MSTGLQFILAVCLLCPLSFAAVQRRQITTVDSNGEFTYPTNFSLPNPSTASGKTYNADGSFNVTTGYISYTQCNDAQSAALWQAVNDAVSLAAGTYGHDGLKKRDGSLVKREQLIDFSSQAAIDYFGPRSRSGPYQQNIFGKSLRLIALRIIALYWSPLWFALTDWNCPDTFKKASLAYPGWGVGDWWYNRYVILSCRDAEKQCDSPGPDGGTVAAYYSPNYLYPAVHFCNAYFTQSPSHSVALNAMKKEKSFQNDNILSSPASRRITHFLCLPLYIHFACESSAPPRPLHKLQECYESCRKGIASTTLSSLS